MHSIAKPATASLAPLIGLACIAACGESPEVGILVNLANLPARTTRIAVKGTLDGRPALADQTELAATGLTRFGIKVPVTARGSLAIDLTVYDSDRCIHGTGALSVNLPTARGTDLSASISAKAPRQCEPLLPCADRTLCTQTKTQNNLLTSVWAISSSDVWAVGLASTALHWDGKTWTPSDSGIPAGLRLRSVWANAPDDVWLVGGNDALTTGQIFHFDGTRWSQSDSGTRYLYSVYGTSKTDIFAVGNSNNAGSVPGEFKRYNAATNLWESIDTGVAQHMYAVWALSPTNVWIAGDQGTLLHYNGTTVSRINLGGTTSALYALSGYLTQNGQSLVLYALGAAGIVVRYDGSSHISNIGTGFSINSVFASSQAVYAVGTNGTTYKSQGVTDSFSGFNTGSDTLYGIHLAPNGIGWVVGDNGFQGYIDTRP